MKYFISIVFVVLGVLSASYAQTEKYTGDGAWAVSEYGDGTVLIIAMGIFRENPDEGARPTFMVNYGGEDGCFVSFGLTMLVRDIPKQLNKKEMLGALKGVLEYSDFLADDEVLTRNNAKIQALDMGGVIYARTLIDSDALAAFMLAKNGAIRMRNEDAALEFDLDGLHNTINRIIDTRCKY